MSVIPRNQIGKVSRTDTPEPVVKPSASPKATVAGEGKASPEVKPGFYSSPNKPSPTRTVRELVNQIGEAVVQVRTPSGLGSGLMLYENRFLMANLQVIEGEAQISGEVLRPED